MNIIFNETEVRRYLVRDRKTGETSTVRVSNRNNIPVEEHMRILNLNDEEHEYLEFLGTVDNTD
ncbi:MAG: hypothetical protein K6B28_04515 [Lachnospiraceae bacterium]|nr:hypothetical protein [Lachnospiraceae bacterium]